MKTVESFWSQPNAMPGWGIVADLTPPELIASRRLRVVRRLVIVAVVAVLVLCAGGFGYAIWRHDEAADALAAEQLRTSTLLAEQRRYSQVTVVRLAIDQVQVQLSGLMGADVDMAALTRSIVTALPARMTIDQLAVTISSAGTLGSGPDGGSSGDKPGGRSGGIGSLDLSKAGHIGTATLSGTGSTLTDLAAYVDALRTAPGIFEPYPLSNQATDTGTTYSLQLTLTDVLLTHRFAAAGGGK